MFDVVKQFIADLVGRSEAPAPPIEDPRLAAAALMVTAIGIDGTVSEAERRAFDHALSSHYGLSSDEAAALAASAFAADREAIDLYGFTSLIKRRVDEAGRLAIVEMLWEVVLADGSLHEFEDNIVWRIAELIAVGTRDRVLLRKKVEARLGRPSESD